MSEFHKLLTTYHGSGPKVLYKQMPNGSYAEVVLTMDLGAYEEQSPLTTARLEKLPQELYYDDEDRLIEILIIDQERGKYYSRILEYENDNLTRINSWVEHNI